MTIFYAYVIIELFGMVIAEYTPNLSGICVLVKERSRTISSMMIFPMTTLYVRTFSKNYLFMLRIFYFTTCFERIFKETVSQTIMIFIKKKSKKMGR